MNQTIFFTHLMPRVYPRPMSMTFFSFFLKYYGVFMMFLMIWHIMRTMSFFNSFEAEIQNLKRKRDDRDDMDEIFESGEFLPKRQRVFRRYPRAPFKFESSFSDSLFDTKIDASTEMDEIVKKEEDVKADVAKVDDVKIEESGS